jgi:DivIVA domain-containing protein
VVLIVIILVGVALLLGAALVMSMYDGGLGEVSLDHGDLGLPDRPLTVDDVPRLRFRTGIRGYRMEDVDAAIDRLGEALRQATSAGHSTSAAPTPTALRPVAPPADAAPAAAEPEADQP